jgi:hypothetical protein
MCHRLALAADFHEADGVFRAAFFAAGFVSGRRGRCTAETDLMTILCSPLAGNGTRA